MNWYFSVLSNYVQFNGRARRAEYWYFFLFNFLISLALGIADLSAATGGWLGNLYSVLVLLPSLAVGVRRMHDVGKSGWFILIPFYNLVLLCTAGDEGTNEYGMDPKAEEVAA